MVSSSTNVEYFFFVSSYRSTELSAEKTIVGFFEALHFYVNSANLKLNIQQPRPQAYDVYIILLTLSVYSPLGLVRQLLVYLGYCTQGLCMDPGGSPSNFIYQDKTPAPRRPLSLYLQARKSEKKEKKRLDSSFHTNNDCWAWHVAR